MRHLLSSIVVIASAGQATADFIQVQADGFFEILEVHPDQINIIFDAPVLAQKGGLGLTSVNGEATHVFTDDETDLFYGSGQLVGDTPDDILVYMFEAVILTGDVTSIFDGTWTVDGGFGDFEGFTGRGDLSGFYMFLDANSGQFSIEFQGDVVPASTTLAPLVAAAAMASRRRR
jgi:hypothetical protein